MSRQSRSRSWRSSRPAQPVRGGTGSWAPWARRWLGIVGGPAVGGCIDPLSLNSGPCAWTVPAAFSWDVFKQVVAQGALAGLAGGLIVIGVQALRNRRTADELHAAGVPS